MADNKGNSVEWIGSSYDDWVVLPDDVQDVLGYALHLAQLGGKANNTKPLKGCKGAGVLEIVDDYLGDTYRGIYTVKFENVVYVLHVFKKKSSKGIATPKKAIQLVEQRLKTAKTHYEAYYQKG